MYLRFFTLLIFLMCWVASVQAQNTELQPDQDPARRPQLVLTDEEDAAFTAKFETAIADYPQISIDQPDFWLLTARTDVGYFFANGIDGLYLYLPARRCIYEVVPDGDDFCPQRVLYKEDTLRKVYAVLDNLALARQAVEGNRPISRRLPVLTHRQVIEKVRQLQERLQKERSHKDCTISTFGWGFGPIFAFV